MFFFFIKTLHDLLKQLDLLLFFKYFIMSKINKLLSKQVLIRTEFFSFTTTREMNNWV